MRGNYPSCTSVFDRVEIMKEANNLDEIEDSDEDKTIIEDPIILELSSLPNNIITCGTKISNNKDVRRLAFSSYHSFWSQTEPRQIVYFISAFLRLIPANASNKIHDFAVFSIFLYSIFKWIIIFFSVFYIQVNAFLFKTSKESVRNSGDFCF